MIRTLQKHQWLEHGANHLVGVVGDIDEVPRYALFNNPMLAVAVMHDAMVSPEE